MRLTKSSLGGHGNAMSTHELIAELLADPERFYRNGRWTLLRDAYDNGAPIASLAQLIRNSAHYTALSVFSILEDTGADLQSITAELGTRLTDEDPYIGRIAMTRSVTAGPAGYANVLALLEHEEPRVGDLAIDIVAHTNRNEDAALLDSNAATRLKPMHAEGVTVLASGKMATNAEIVTLLESKEPLLRTYGIIAARRLAADRPELQST